MELKIGTRTIKLFTKVTIDLRYDTIASSFSCGCYFNPDSAEDRYTFRPGSFHDCTITHNGVLILTGTVVTHKFESAGDPPKHLVWVSGYSRPGVLMDSNYGIYQYVEPGTTLPPAANQFTNQNIEQIAKTLCKAFWVDVVVDKEVLDDPVAMSKYGQVATIEQDTKVGNFLDDLCKQRNLVLTHTTKGELLITKPKVGSIRTTQATYVREDVQTTAKLDVYDDPGNVYTSQIVTEKSRPLLYRFKSGDAINTRMSLDFDGQNMHRRIQVLGDSGRNSVESLIYNPYVGIEPRKPPFRAERRFRRFIQTAPADMTDTSKDTARSVLGDELKGISVSIDIDRWVLGGHLVTPNQLITAVNPDIYLFKETTLFIKSVTLMSDEVTETAKLTCVLPDCFLSTDVKNIFA